MVGVRVGMMMPMRAVRVFKPVLMTVPMVMPMRMVMAGVM